MSISQRAGNTRNAKDGGVGGGQCAQFAMFYNAYKNNKYSSTRTESFQANILWKKFDNLKNVTETNLSPVRKNINSCEEGDLVLLETDLVPDTSHIQIFKELDKDKNDNILGYKAIESNWKGKERLSISKLHKNNYGVINSNNIYSVTNYSKTGGKFLCVNMNSMTEANSNISTDSNKSQILQKRFSTILNDEVLDYSNPANTATWDTINRKIIEKPWLYYLVDTIGNGVSWTTTDGDKYYGFDPDILPVTSLKIDNAGNIIGDEDSRYEIYVSNSFKSNSKFRLTGFNTKQSDEDSNSDTIKNLNISTQSLKFNDLYFKRLKQKDTNMTEFKLIPDGGVENYDKRYELRTNVGANENFDSNKKVLFSPTIIDDYYVSRSTDNKNYDHAKLPIGFWNSNGYDMNLSTSVTPDTANAIYQSTEALNGYYMTLGKNKSAEWHFALAGKHTIMVNIPTGKYTDINKTEYKLHNFGEKAIKLIPHKFKKALSKDTAFKNWFLLYQEENGTKKYDFNLTGNEYVSVSTGKEQLFAIVDGIKIQSLNTILSDAKVVGSVKIKNIESVLALKVKVNIYKEKCLFFGFANCSFINKIGSIVLEDDDFEDGFEYHFEGLEKGTYKLVYTLGEQRKEKFITLSIIRDSNTFDITEYKPQIMEFKIVEDNEIKQLPDVYLTKNLTKDSVKIKVINATTGLAISNANVTVRFGLDRDDNTSAYSGITDNDGSFEVLNMAYGQYSFILNKDGFISTSLNLTVDKNTTDSKDLSMSPILSIDTMRIRLTWGQSPSDLDSHLVKKTDGNQDYHIYYSNSNDSTTGDMLDRDDTNGEGPETITINKININSIYTYYVHDFNNGSSSIKNSSASVKISSGNTEFTYYPPNDDGEYWRVFTIKNGIVKHCTSNCMGTTESTMTRSFSRSKNRESDLFRNLPSK
jgi:hypothetical protein